MNRTYNFLKECGAFFVVTVNESVPAARPFGAVMELEGELYISTSNTKDVYKQLAENPAFQIVAMKAGTRDWIRINGNAVEVHDLNIKQAMLDACPALTKHFDSNSNAEFAIFKISDMVSTLNINGEVISLT
jgi:uncharacterized pyridoxamine 5'-phosphate oxidase family protein